MEETVKLISAYGGLAIMATLFLYDWYDGKKNEKEYKKQTNDVLCQLASSNNNIAESLNILKTSMDNQTNEFKQHDERAISEFQKLNDRLCEIKQEIIRK